VVSMGVCEEQACRLMKHNHTARWRSGGRERVHVQHVDMRKFDKLVILVSWMFKKRLNAECPET
jgi:hypothetical protein